MCLPLLKGNIVTTPGNLFILSAPSGAGKSSLIKALLSQESARPMQVSVSHTTRAPRPGENNGEHYHFISVDQFQKQIKQNEFYEYAEVFGNYYGTSASAIDKQLAQGIDVFLDIDWQGAKQVRIKQPSVTTIFISPPSKVELENRLKNRGQDSDATIKSRMAQAKAECSHYTEFDYIIVNNDFTQALSELTTIVNNQRLRCQQQAITHQSMFEELLKD
ncbi:guanylate kinase [Colwellia sp. MB3u-28]|nr:guanylate kinase [Colwellia sp. MB02u-7]MBA6235035.1 guanylate kinase [Colwellia sp. MB02u-11]MBA6257581.1 guanylate kinase [Colwellia sp. MB3u-28]MBA6260653.1 guanylate kinase [Colwellia sp. MB3u-41]MBA6301756.1 guanylate kinase [Colwellia sp. MB3u-22]MBA6303286.1 guanylate kinase [Colwellia sp. MB02u-14]MBA6309270.1 guanylate kinase [Colwellia sp. MB3u-64]